MSLILDTRYLHPKEQIVVAMTRIYKRGLTTTSGGNISMIDENGDLWISPSGIDKGSLTPDDIMCIAQSGEIIGKHKPSSEYPFHRAIYQMRPDIKALIHAHPPALVSFSIARKRPNTYVTYQAQHICGTIGYAPYALPGSEALGKVIAAEFEKGHKAIIMENHGTVLGGSDMVDAYDRFETLEFCAKTILNASTIGTPSFLTDEMIASYRKQMPKFELECTVSHYSPAEKLVRKEMYDIIQRALQHDLMFSSIGTISSRLEGNDFVITPSDISRWDITPKDLVLIKDGKREAGKSASDLAWLHQKIYEENPDIYCIINTQPTYLMAFAITNAYFDVRTIPESWIFLQDVPVVPFSAIKQAESGDLLAYVKNGATAVLIQNGTALVTGGSILKTFDYLEVAEFSAKSIVKGSVLGQMVPINHEQVEDLRKAFLS